MTIRYYSSLDTGAPSLPSNAGQRFLDNLKLILMACLVNGYDSKPAAGWSLGHDHADGFSLSNGEGLINFVSVSHQAVAVYIMESISDGSTALAQGYNRRSGAWFDGQSTSIRHYHYSEYLRTTYQNKHWAVVADERTATLLWLASDTALEPSYYGGGALHFGAYYPSMGGAGFCALGGQESNSAGAWLFYPGYWSGAVLRNPFDGTIAQGAEPKFRAGVVCQISAVQRSNKAQPSPGVLRPVRAGLVGSGAGISGSTSSGAAVHCGLLRGIVADPALSDLYVSKVLPLLGVASPTYLDKLRPVTLPNGKQWVPLYPHYSDLGAFVSLYPADWD